MLEFLGRFNVNHRVFPALTALAHLWLISILAGTALAPEAQASEIVLHNFACPPGAFPEAGVIRDSDGNFYGTASMGGANNWGVVYKFSAKGQLTILHSFTGGADGAESTAGVIRDSAGNLYGTSEEGGTFGAGVVYKLDSAGSEVVLYTFTNGADGAYPSSGLIRDPVGNFYGTAGGGINGAGVIYRLDTTGHQTVLYSFTGGADGWEPYGGVIRDSAGNLYGATDGGGAANAGVVFKLNTTGQLTVLHSFTNADGYAPQSGLIRDSDGNLYGTTTFGGTSGAGVVYKLDRTGKETLLYSFTGGADGNNPQAGVIRDSAGNLYGTTAYGGSANMGVVYKLDPTGLETVLYSFTGAADGSHPSAGVIQDSTGNLYGTTAYGGAARAGVVYEVNGSGQETALYGFTGGPDGGVPYAGLVRDPAGNFYGTTYYGGTWNSGVVYELDPAQHETVLYSFTGLLDGGNPYAGVIRDSTGNLYGTTVNGGTNPSPSGLVYKLDTAGQETVLHTFTDYADGGEPYAGVISDSTGNLYGAADYGTSKGHGVLYELNTSGVDTVLHSFSGLADGGNPRSGMILDAAGNLYGTAWDGGSGYAGVVYKVSATHPETVLYNFTGAADGGQPYGGVILDSSGNLYGTTLMGGTANAGVVYKLDQAGHETVLYSFTGGPDGGYPNAGVIRDSEGNLYGTTVNGGLANAGVVYKLDSAGQETVLYSFTGGADGGNPYSVLIRDSAGDLYGTTAYGGEHSGGVLFKVTP